MEFIRRLFTPSAKPGSGRSDAVSTLPSLQASELVAFGDEVNRLSVEFDIEALIVSHERWIPWLWHAVQGQVDEQLRPDVICDERSSELGAWLHEAGRKALGHLPAYDMLLLRNRYFHTKASELVALSLEGETARAEQAFKQAEHASRQMILLLKELKRGLVRNPSAMSGKRPDIPLRKQ